MNEMKEVRTKIHECISPGSYRIQGQPHVEIHIHTWRGTCGFGHGWVSFITMSCGSSRHLDLMVDHHPTYYCTKYGTSAPESSNLALRFGLDGPRFLSVSWTIATRKGYVRFFLKETNRRVRLRLAGSLEIRLGPELGSSRTNSKVRSTC
jgi:hypothetical protein